jgi:ATP-binding cassette subfamily F protein 3
VRQAEREEQRGEARARRDRDKERKREEAAQRQSLYRELKPLRNSLKKTEDNIAALEREKERVEAALGSEETYKSDELARTLTAEYREVTTRLAYLYDEWTKTAEQIEAIEREGGQ